MSLNTADTKIQNKVKYSLFNSKFLHRKKRILTKITVLEKTIIP